MAISIMADSSTSCDPRLLWHNHYRSAYSKYYLSSNESPKVQN